MNMNTKRSPMMKKDYRNVSHLIPAAFDMIGQKAVGETSSRSTEKCQNGF